MLETFVDMQPGDVVVQNGANSAVGKVRRSRSSLTINKPVP